MKPKNPNPTILTVNGGSSSIKFALFNAGEPMRRIVSGQIAGVGLPKGTLVVKGPGQADNFSRLVAVPDYKTAVKTLMAWLHHRGEPGAFAAVGHRLVHGGPKFWKPQRISAGMIDQLRQISPFDPEHLPQAILLIESFRKHFPRTPQIACFDTAFHHDLPSVARLLPIPRRYEAKGIRRYGFHGLSCAYLLAELARTAGAKAARGRVILAHLGNGASMTAVLGGKSFDTTMSFTPTAGLVMGSRSGDLDPSLAYYLSRTEKMTPKQFNRMTSHQSGLLGISEISSDMRELLAREHQDLRAAEAVAIFCYQARKWVGALSAALGGLDTLVFSGGIGENNAEVRQRICAGLEFLGGKLDQKSNRASASIISRKDSPVTIRVIRTDEESVIARTVIALLNRK